LASARIHRGYRSGLVGSATNERAPDAIARTGTLLRSLTGSMCISADLI